MRANVKLEPEIAPARFVRPVTVQHRNWRNHTKVDRKRFHMRSRILLVGGVLVTMQALGCASLPKTSMPPAYGTTGTPQIFDGMGPHTHHHHRFTASAGVLQSGVELDVFVQPR